MYLFEQKTAALYYQTGKLVTLIMALMKSVATPTLYGLIEEGIVHLFSFVLNNSPLFKQIIKDFEVQPLSQSIFNLNQLLINFLTLIHYCLNK